VSDADLRASTSAAQRLPKTKKAPLC